MATNLQSNPLYYSFSLPSSNALSSPASRTVVLQKKSNQNSFGVYVGQDVPTGLYVVTVETGSPAHHAQIQPGDRVLAVNGQLISQMTGNPKNTLMDLALHSRTLTLTIESTDIFQKLNLPRPSSSGQSETTTMFSSQPPIIPARQPISSTRQQQGFRTKSLEVNSDLESYIKSLFGDENIQIMPSADVLSNSNEFVLKTGRKDNTSSFNNRYVSTRSSDGDRRPLLLHHHHHTRRHPRRSKRVPLRTTETQTSFSDENSPSPPTRTFPSVQPSMGTSHILLRTQKVGPNDSGTTESRETTNTKPSIEAIPAVRVTRPSPPVVIPTGGRKASTDDDDDDKDSPSAPPQHMADIVQAAMDATRTRDQEEKRREQETKRQPARQTSPIEERPSLNGEVYSVRQAEEKSANPYAPTVTKPAAAPPPAVQPFPSSIRGENLRRVHLARSKDFSGYGFHLQYNKVYYLVHRVENRSPSETGNLRANDVIHSINGKLTEKMPHSDFVQIVNGCAELDLIVQNIDDYLRAYPEASRNPTSATKPGSAATPSNSNPTDSGKKSNGISRAFGLLGNNNR